ncbi:hypothetical protein [Sphingobium sp. WCS2017Hpa-17]|uniref:hypothetical protein n=1 Tax=Sphingobium sp. WCS2017Hpa-17 TaxID=3073638 RepID=UPI002889FCC8|nr:hypothetical protein [Sphingobium sp. WCS2017Hpa-17]
MYGSRLDTIEHFMGGGAEGKAAMANWLRGGFEMDRKGQWRLKPQVADTLQRDVQAVMTQTGWQRAIDRSALDQNSFTFGGEGRISGATGKSIGRGKGQQSQSSGQVGGSLSVSSSEVGQLTESANSHLDIVNFDVRQAISRAERSAANSSAPHRAFSVELSEQVLGKEGLRNRYLQEADAGRGTFDLTSPITSMEQSSILSTGRSKFDVGSSYFDGDGASKAPD